MIVSITIVRYRRAFVPFALLAMALHRLPLTLQKGCSFWKLLGSGRNGTFDLHPDWQQWGLLAVWETREDFDHFYHSSFISKWWRSLTFESWTMLGVPLQSHGKWDGKEPFGKPDMQEYNGPIAVLTRATIRISRLKSFWQNAAGITAIMNNTAGFVTSFGIGEAPLYRQATFSVWENIDDVKAFAYRTREHAEVIRKTRDEKWYSEDYSHGLNPLRHGALYMVKIL